MFAGPWESTLGNNWDSPKTCKKAAKGNQEQYRRTTRTHMVRSHAKGGCREKAPVDECPLGKTPRSHGRQARRAGPMHGRGARGEDQLFSKQHLESQVQKKIKFDNLSSGHKPLLAISILGSEGDGPILIDEPELSLHMDWQLAMKDIVQSLVNHSKRQVFIASHSPDVILKFNVARSLLGEEVSDIDA